MNGRGDVVTIAQLFGDTTVLHAVLVFDCVYIYVNIDVEVGIFRHCVLLLSY